MRAVTEGRDRIVVAAVIRRADRVLAARRRHPREVAGRWEFPGGAVEPGEAPRDALRREIAEELGWSIDVGDRVGPETTIAGVGRLRAFWADGEAGVPVPGIDHDEVRWLGPDELAELDWLDPDVPIAEEVAARLRSDSPPAAADERVRA